MTNQVFSQHFLQEASRSRYPWAKRMRLKSSCLNTFFFGVLGSFFLFQSGLAISHSEDGQYDAFEAPGFSWTESSPFSDGVGQVRLKNGLAYIDKTGKVVLATEFDTGDGFRDGRARVCKNFRCGYIDRSGHLVIPLKYLADVSLGYFAYGRAVVHGENGCGYINIKGDEVIPLIYHICNDFSEGLASVRTKNFQWQIIDEMGKVVKDNLGGNFLSGDLFLSFEGQLISIKTGRTVPLEQRYDWVRPFREGVAAVAWKGQGGFIDQSGRLVLKLGSVLAESFHDGLAVALKGEKWGFIDRTGRFVIQPQFEMAQAFSEGLAAVKVKEKWGYIGRDGKMKIPAIFALPGVFSEGIAAVQLEEHADGYAYIDQNGKVIWKGRFH